MKHGRALHQYDKDLCAWSMEQVLLLREKRFDLLDVEHIVEEIEDVSRSVRHELASRMVVLMAHLLKWQHQTSHRVPGWQRTIQAQRKSIRRLLSNSPSLNPTLQDDGWLDEVWAHAVAQACNETQLDCFPEQCPWLVSEEVLSDSWMP